MTKPWRVRSGLTIISVIFGYSMRLALPDWMLSRKYPGTDTINVLALVFAVLSFGLFAILLYLFGYTRTTLIIVLAAVVFLSVIVLNKFGRLSLAKITFCVAPVTLALVATLVGKLTPNQSYIIYFDSRFIILASSILPAIVFDFNEKKSLIFTTTLSFLCLVLFDPIHNLFGLGYYQVGHAVASYYYINYITFVSFTALASGIFVLKYRQWKAFRTIENANHEITAQNEELRQQQEEMQANQEMLERANQLISQQKGQLEEYNVRLEQMVSEKSGDLLKSNRELIKSNNELQQFSYTVSHNLRGPVARLLGLTHLIHHAASVEETAQMIGFVRQSAQDLDEVLRDLNTIIDIRNELTSLKEKVVLQDEWDRAIHLLQAVIPVDCTIETNFEVPAAFGIRAMMGSIIFNLISNAIKYRRPIPLVIKASSFTDEANRLVIEVSDNGLGIDLESHQKDLFKLYKRFHSQALGKGLGLYLVKSQMEIMGGTISVRSQVEQGTTFTLQFPAPVDMDRQVIYESDSAQLYYDANLNITVIIWKQHISSLEYRAAFETVLRTIKRFKTPGWIADLRQQGKISSTDQQWFVKEVLKPAAENGLTKIAAVGFEDPVRAEYYERMKVKTAEYGITFQALPDMSSAIFWMSAH